jgi:hypothetical protein
MSGSLQEALDRLCRVEQELDLFKYQVDGWSAWPVIRFELSLLLTGLSFPHSSPSNRTSRAFHALNTFPALLHVRQARYLFKTYSSWLLEETDGRYQDIRFDDVMTAAGSVFKIEAPSGSRFSARSRHALIKSDLSSTAVEAVATLAARRISERELQRPARVFAKTVRDELCLKAVDDEWVARRLRRFVANKRVYRSILRRVGPQFVLVADPGEHALIAAAKEHGSSVLELQHGVADASNASYVWPSAAKSHRARMPIPDRLLLWGEHWRRELDREGFWGDSLRVVGSPRLDRYRQHAVGRSHDRCTILFTTQGLDVGLVSRFLSEALNQVIPEVPLRLFVKLHPIYDVDSQPYRDALAPFHDHVEVLTAQEGPSTFEFLQRANLHLSIASASHYDAVGLGVPTIILPFTTHDIVLPMFRAGDASLARTVDDLAMLIRNWQSLNVSTDVSEYYFRSDALANILRELNLPRADVRN